MVRLAFLAAVPLLAVGFAASAGAASSCQSAPAFDVSALLKIPYSFRDGSTNVMHRQWRLADKNYATATTGAQGASLRLERSDGRVCGPVSFTPRGGSNWASVGTLSNTGHSIRACVRYSGGRSVCGAWKRE